MPYLALVPTGKRLEVDVVTQIKNLLEEFGSRGYCCYWKVRWRHVGCSKNENGELVVTMLDMESLEHQADSDPPTSIRTQMETLIRCSGEGSIDERKAQQLLEKLGFDKTSQS
jgi:hypothetical protein